MHVLINNAAAFIFKSVEDATAEDWDRSAAVSIKYSSLLSSPHSRLPSPLPLPLLSLLSLLSSTFHHLSASTPPQLCHHYPVSRRSFFVSDYN